MLKLGHSRPISLPSEKAARKLIEIANPGLKTDRDLIDLAKTETLAAIADQSKTKSILKKADLVLE
jgi:hypothetical protein